MNSAEALDLVILYADGGARGNPGPAGAGAVLTDRSGKILARLHRYLGEATNNTAEYSALILGLEEASRLAVKKIVIRLDSELIVRQLEGRYRVKQPHLQILHQQARNLLQRFEKVAVQHIPREKNFEADRLANLAMDERSSSSPCSEP